MSNMSSSNQQTGPRSLARFRSMVIEALREDSSRNFSSQPRWRSRLLPGRKKCKKKDRPLAAQPSVHGHVTIATSQVLQAWRSWRKVNVQGS